MMNNEIVDHLPANVKAVFDHVLLGRDYVEPISETVLNLSQEISVADVIESSEFKEEVLLALLLSNKIDTSRFCGYPDLRAVSNFADILGVSFEHKDILLGYKSWPDLFAKIINTRQFAESLPNELYKGLFEALSIGLNNWNLVFPESIVDSKDDHEISRSDREIIMKSGLFDSIWYLKQYPDVAASDFDPVVHYLKFGGYEGRNPSIYFDSKKYLQVNEDVADLGQNPLLHWLRYGKAEGRYSSLSFATATENKINDFHPAVINEIYKIIKEAGEFSDVYYFSHYPDIMRSGMDPLEHYIKHGYYENRNPSAEFDTWYYKTSYPQHSEGPAAGLLHYIKHGKSAGLRCRPSNSLTIDPNKSPNAGAKDRIRESRIAIHLHLFYVDLIEDFCDAFANIPFDFDLHVTTCSEINLQFIARVFSDRLHNCQVKVDVIENRGRDIAPFVDFLNKNFNDYDFVCHLHSKKSKHTNFGTAWRHWVLDSMFGNEGIVADCLNHLVQNPDVGLLYPDNFFEIKQYIKIDNNELYLDSFFKRINTNNIDYSNVKLFAAGSMMWIRTAAIQNLVEASIDVAEFDKEDNQVDLTLAHMLERAFPLIVQGNGFKTTCCYLTNRTPIYYKKTYEVSVYNDKVTDKWVRDNVEIAKNLALPLAPLNKLFCENRIDIHWIVPDFGRGAGGHMTIFRIIEQLEMIGHRQTIWIQNCFNHANPAAAKAFIQKNYRKFSDHVVVRFLPEDVRQLSGDVIIATDLWTVFPAQRAQNFKARFYFIQDYEPLFHPMGEMYLTASSTYSENFMALCAGDWLLQKVTEHGMWARPWFLASDPEFYFENNAPKIMNRTLKIAFYCRSYTPRRATALGITAFRELRNRGLDFELILFGEEARDRNISGHVNDLGILAPRELGDLYRQCDIGVVFSTTNYSLVPLEMMACGLPVVEIDTESSRAAFPPNVVGFAKANPICIADEIEKLIVSEDKRKTQSQNAKEFIAGFSWVESAKLIDGYIKEGLLNNNCEAIDPLNVCKSVISRKHTASVVIPTYNGGQLLLDVVERALSQNYDSSYEIVIVDSGSTDGTSESLEKHNGSVRVHRIDKSQFQHGRTRNLAISLTDSDYVAVITQDALPANQDWLKNLMAGFDRSDRIAGVIGRHVAYPDHNKFVERDLNNMFKKFNELTNIYSLDRMLPSLVYHGGLEDRIIKQFYSDNNSAMRRSVWEKLPYPEIDWGEDQVWCWEMLKLGFEKYYAHDAVVYHSHAIDEKKEIEVGIEEGMMFGVYFGIDLGSSDIEVPTSMLIELRKYALSKGINVSEIEDYVKKFSISQQYRREGYSKSLII
ncbi:rhamnan synthesis F family protein [Methylobacterium indicum]|uniref:rhamnosyltransferase WsaF family glycosyltransferase n=1 Tax=Methylobacterium indicum TaxID=1775910 RepID=UPI000A7FD25C|nr:rhamnan synthesis F family protein [Methylobacterium indicum]